MTAPPADLVPSAEAALELVHNPGNQATGGIWRVGGRILKLVTPPGAAAGLDHWPTSDRPEHWNYWRREALAYATRLASTAYPGIAAPELLELVERPDGSVALWLADVAGRPGPEWTIDALAEFARRLGGGHLDWLDSARFDRPAGRRQRRPAAYPWLSRGWLRAYTLSRPVVEPVPWDLPIVAAVWPQPLRDGLRELWRRRHHVLEVSERLPVTLCHHDVWPMNLIGTDSGPVLLDWSFVGMGAVGEDAANLILDTFLDGMVDVAALAEVTEAVLDGYTTGLAGALDPAQVRRAVQVTGAAKYAWLAPGMLVNAARGGHGGSPNYDRRSREEIFAQRRPIFEQVVAWAGAALD